MKAELAFLDEKGWSGGSLLPVPSPDELDASRSTKKRPVTVLKDGRRYSIVEIDGVKRYVLEEDLPAES